MNCVYATLFFNIFEFGLLDSRLDLNRIFQMHNMTIKFSIFVFFVFFAFFVLTSCLLRATTHAIGGLLDLSIISHERIVLKGVVFWSKDCSCHFCPKKRLWLKSVPEKWAIFFLVNVPQDNNQRWFWNIMVLRLVFLVIEKELAGLKL